MRRDLQNLANETYDVLIIGGGVNGVASAWDATQRGLKTALVERADYGGQTSSASLKIIHGGLRYLQHMDFSRMRESIYERSAFLRIAPHLVEPFPFLVPTYGYGAKGRGAMSVALAMNDFISRDRNQNLADPAQQLPGGRTFGRSECLALAPGISEEGLTGGAVFHDARMHNAERTTLSFALAADAAGADLANYVEVIGFERKGSRLVAARVRDTLSGEEWSIRAKVFVNTTGPWWEGLPQRLNKPDATREVTKSAGIQIITRPCIMQEEMGLAFPSQHRDPEARLQRGARHYFLTPWRGHTIWGTTDRLYQGDPDTWRISAEEVAAFITEINQALPGVELSSDDVSYAFGGLRPIEGKNLHRGSQVTRRYEIYDHHQDAGVDNLLSIEGIKYTACRIMAEKMIDQVFGKLDRESPPCRTAETPLPGGDISRRKYLLAEVASALPADAPQTLIQHLARNYGSRFRQVTDLMDETRDVSAAETLHALREESALRLSDVILRRSDLGTLGHPGKEVLESSAQLMAVELGWDAPRKAEEIRLVAAKYPF